ncbi:MAG TPA: D-alanyl-D-alanine carboxypeptidase [Patescibacteria group bacterium]|nr:D-alanyl-D-alanine carboxypeptidase [Patescibacteria group bacterium]
MNPLKKKDHFLFLAILAFIFVSSTALSLSKSFDVSTLLKSVVKGEEKTFPPLPVLSGKNQYPILSAQGVMAVDLDSGINLYEKNADFPLLPASTTKIITALVSLDTYKLDQILTVGMETKVVGQKMGLYYGEQMKVEDLLYGLLVYSANDAAEVLATNYSGGYDAFIVAMNAKAGELSMINSKFDNPVGLDTFAQRSTAKDLVRASEVAMRNPEFAKIVGTKQTIIHDVSGKSSYNLRNINELLGVVPGVMGVKTGWTENARENLVTYIERDGHKIMIAVLGSQDRFGETKELIDWIFTSYSWQEIKLPN